MSKIISIGLGILFGKVCSFMVVAYHMPLFVLFLHFGLSIFIVKLVNPVYAIACLILVYIGGAFLTFYIGFDYLGLTFIIVYVGAIAVLFLFIVMMLNLSVTDFLYNNSEKKSVFPKLLYRIPFILRFVLFSVLFYIYFSSLKAFFTHPFFIALTPQIPILKFPTFTNINSEIITNFDLNHFFIIKLGHILYSDFFISFIIAAILLLAAMLGAIMLTTAEKRIFLKKQDVFKQLSRDFKKTVYISKFNSE